MNVTALKTAIFALACVPLAKVATDVFELFGGSLGANPVEALLHRMGWWGLFFMLVTLTVTPLRNLTGMTSLVRVRRMLGLFAFTYIALHFTVYAVLDQGLAIRPIIEDIFKRPYITVGIAGLLLLLPLAITSNSFSQRRLKQRWKKLHKLTYVIAVLGVWHFWWQVKKDAVEPMIFAGVLAILLGYRIVLWRRAKARKRG
ncbi:MAG: sulfite oxidase heme-binding subunit YedZ [Gammaproteobacteria bacterium]